MNLPGFPLQAGGCPEDPLLERYAALAEDVHWLLQAGEPECARVPYDVIETLERGVAELGRIVEQLARRRPTSTDGGADHRARTACPQPAAVAPITSELLEAIERALRELAPGQRGCEDAAHDVSHDTAHDNAHDPAIDI